jgi:hypothetical protein
MNWGIWGDTISPVEPAASEENQPSSLRRTCGDLKLRLPFVMGKVPLFALFDLDRERKNK